MLTFSPRLIDALAGELVFPTNEISREYREIDAIAKRSHALGNAAVAAATAAAAAASEHAKWRRVTSRWFLYRCRICGAFRKRSRPDAPTHRSGRHEITRRPKACRPILHGSTTSWPAARLIAGVLHCGKYRSHTRGTGESLVAFVEIFFGRG